MGSWDVEVVARVKQVCRSLTAPRSKVIRSLWSLPDPDRKPDLIHMRDQTPVTGELSQLTDLNKVMCEMRINLLDFFFLVKKTKCELLFDRMNQ